MPPSATSALLYPYEIVASPFASTESTVVDIVIVIVTASNELVGVPSIVCSSDCVVVITVTTVEPSGEGHSER